MAIACTAPGKVCNKYCKLNNFSATCRKKRFGIPKKVKVVKELIESNLTVKATDRHYIISDVFVVRLHDS